LPSAVNSDLPVLISLIEICASPVLEQLFAINPDTLRARFVEYAPQRARHDARLDVAISNSFAVDGTDAAFI
jgi:3-oxoacyl-(acyl-carrier-protein) synthase